MSSRGTQKKEARRMDPKTAARLEKMRQNLTALEQKAETILDKGVDNLTEADRFVLLSLVNVAYHEEGSKIAEIYSIDSSASCEFCSRMICAARLNPLIICGLCYAKADEWKEAAWRRHKLNARILSTVLFSASELSILQIGSLCRFNEDGDTVNATMARNYLRVAASHPETRFGYWFKNAPAVDAGLKAEGIFSREQLPENVRFIQSSILIGFASSPVWFADAVFTVYPDEQSTADAIAAGSHECNGRKCKACGFNCYLMRRRAEPLQIAEFLRANKARRAEILKAYHARKASKEG